MRTHRHTIVEGTRGRRSFLTVYGRGDRHQLLSARCERYWFSGARHTGIGLETDEDSGGLQVSAGIAHVFNVWITAGSPALAGAVYRRWHKHLPDVDVIDVRLHDRALWWSVWHSKWSWTRGTPRWRQGSFHWWDWLTGRPEYHSEITRGPELIGIPMPEGLYLANITLSHDTWTRARWPWPQVRDGYNIDVISRPSSDGPYVPDDGRPGYVPVPGKGENSWDCGADGVFSESGSARTRHEAVGNFVAGVLAVRSRRGERPDYSEPIS